MHRTGTKWLTFLRCVLSPVRDPIPELGWPTIKGTILLRRHLAEIGEMSDVARAHGAYRT